MDSELIRPADAETRFQAVAHSLGVVVFAFVPGVLLVSLGLDVLSALGYAVDPNGLPVQVGGSAVQYVGFFAVGVAYLAYASDRDLFDWGRPDLRDLGLIVGGFAGLYALLTVLGLVFTALGLQGAEHGLITRGRQNPDLFLYMIPVTLLLVAPSEELIFRGIVQGLFRRAYGVVPGVVLASALFGAVHVAAVSGGGAGTGQVALTLATTAALGAVLGVAYELSENLIVPVVVHGLWNTMTFLSQWLAATNGVQVPA